MRLVLSPEGMLPLGDTPGIERQWRCDRAWVRNELSTGRDLRSCSCGFCFLRA